VNGAGELGLDTPGADQRAAAGTGRDGTGARRGAETPDALVTLKTAVRDGRVAITIGDRGAGIAHGDLLHVLDPYFTTKRGGTGLGLPIARNIVEGLGGSLTISSIPGRGTVIDIEIPIVFSTP
jgi:signal transduction histidine kinase